MSAIAAHIRTARESGAKAGFNAYMRTNAPTARERQDEIRAAGNKKAQFAVYCEIFADQLGTTPSAATRSNDQRVSVIERIARKLGVSTSELNDLIDEDENEVGVQVEATTPRKPAQARAGRKPAAKSVPKGKLLSVGDEYLYHGKKKVGEWVIRKVLATHYVCENDNGRQSNWKHTTFHKLVDSGKIDLI